MIGKCEKCGYTLEIQEHHILPKGVRKNNVSIKEGKRIWLCKECHKEIHLKLKEYCEKFTEEWLHDRC